MIYLLDTNAWINFLNSGHNAVKEKIASTDQESIRLCSVVKAELYYCAAKSSHPHENLNMLERLFAGVLSFDFDDAAAGEYGRIRTQLAEAGTPIGPNDLMIAAIAVVNQCVLVTHNVREFSRISALQIEDWEL